jgi:hypothetical protein
LAGGKLAVQPMTPPEVDRLAQHPVMNGHLPGGKSAPQLMIPLERDLHQERP